MPHKPVNPNYRDPNYIRNRKTIIDFAWDNRQPCCICGFGFNRKSDITAEHIQALRYSGTNDLSNLGPAHRLCNYGKHKAR